MELFPNNLGLEFMPYWANDHGISLEEYLYPKASLDQIYRNSSFSLASTQKLPYRTVLLPKVEPLVIELHSFLEIKRIKR